jgi:O-antigen ligase
MKISRLILSLLGICALFYIGQFICTQPFKIIIFLVVGFILAILSLVSTKFGLFFLIFVIAFTQQLSLANIEFSYVQVGTDDFLILFIIFSWICGLIRRKEPFFLKTSLNWPLAAFFAASIFPYIGTAINMNVSQPYGIGFMLISILHLFKLYEYVFVYFIVISVIKNLEEVKKYIFMFFIVVGILVIIQIVAMIVLGATGTPTGRLMHISVMHAISSNAILGAYYDLLLFIIIAVLLDTAFSKTKVFLILLSIMISFALFNTYSRSAYLGLIAGFLILGRLKEKRLFLVVLLFLALAPVYMQPAVFDRIALTVRTVKPTVVLDESSTIRLFLWKRAIQLFLTSPIFGRGYWTARYAMGGTEAHNQYLSILLDTGLIGFSIFCWLIIRMYNNAIVLKKNANTPFLKSLGVGYIAGLSAVLVGCFFSENLESFNLTGPLWFITALIVSANRLLLQKKEKLEIDST